MSITPMAFSPANGLRDSTTYPTTPANEAAAREQIQGRLDEIRDYINDTLNVEVLPKDGGEIKNYSETLTTIASATGTVDLDISNGNVFDVALSGNTTFTFSNPAASGKVCSFTVILNQDATGRTVTWPASVKWSNDTSPDIATANKTSILTFVTKNSGTRWYGFLGGNNFTT
ncbi:MAG: hypothetical protein N3I35_06745 [Clostridia bacterium]|nr:hypothetical protein [Clostridia bacterium]